MPCAPTSSCPRCHRGDSPGTERRTRGTPPSGRRARGSAAGGTCGRSDPSPAGTCTCAAGKAHGISPEPGSGRARGAGRPQRAPRAIAHILGPRSAENSQWKMMITLLLASRGRTGCSSRNSCTSRCSGRLTAPCGETGGSFSPLCLPFNFLQGRKDAAPLASPTIPLLFPAGNQPLRGWPGTFQGAAPSLWGFRVPLVGAVLLLSGGSVSSRRTLDKSWGGS